MPAETLPSPSNDPANDPALSPLYRSPGNSQPESAEHPNIEGDASYNRYSFPHIPGARPFNHYTGV